MAIANASRNQVAMDGRLLTGSLLASGGVFPSAGYAATVPGGPLGFVIRDTLSTTTQVPLAFSANLQAGKQYVIFIYDTITAPRQRTVETPITIPADSTARLRFANFVYTRTAIPAVDIFSKRLNQNLFTNVNVTEVTNFIPFPSNFTDTLFVRSTGTTTNLATLNGMNLNPKRSYTVVFRGSYLATTGAGARALSFFANY
ncbi:MAG: hypothetical protein N2747_07980 [Chitinophagaceae bacterium]|nr:hypothetical protein [Chitinophagaceae bacterium]